MKFQLSAVLAMMVASTSAYVVVPPTSTSVRASSPATQLQMAAQEHDDNAKAAASLFAASVIAFSSATATLLPAPVDAATAAPTAEQIKAMTGAEKEYYKVKSSYDLATQSATAYSNYAKEAKNEASALKKSVAEAQKTLTRTQTAYQAADDSFNMAKANKLPKDAVNELKSRLGKWFSKL